MKSFFYLLLCLTGGTLQAQSITAQPLTKEQIQQGLGDQLANGYQTSIDGWVMHKGDTLQLGKSTPTNNPFVYLYQTITDPKTITKPAHLAALYSGKRVLLKDMVIRPGQPGRFTLYGLVSVNGLTYDLDVENAIRVGELLPPIKYRPSAQASPAVPVLVADELIKLKAQLAAGTISQAEFDARKKKLLDHK